MIGGGDDKCTFYEVSRAVALVLYVLDALKIKGQTSKHYPPGSRSPCFLSPNAMFHWHSNFSCFRAGGDFITTRPPGSFNIALPREALFFFSRL